MKIIALFLMLIMLISCFNVLANVKNNEEIVEIRVAIYRDRAPSGIGHFLDALENYEWKVGKTLYRIIVEVLSTEQLVKGELTIDKYDVFLYSAWQTNEYCFHTSFSRLPKNKIRVRNIVNFIKDGGGYFGTCGAAMLAGRMQNRPKTLFEHIWNKSCFGISCQSFHFKNAIPIFLPSFGLGPEAVDISAYYYNTGTGLCLDCPIFHDNPIFDDYLEDTRRIEWAIGRPLEIPKNPDREVKILANYPSEEISDNESLRIHHWKYTGGIRGIIKAILLDKNSTEFCENLGPFNDALYFSSDWERTDKIVKTNLSNKPFMTSEVYPNENKARIVLTTGHPENAVWWGGYLEEKEDNDNNCLWDGLYQWKDIIPEEETIEDEVRYNYWIISRSVAWASKKVPDNDLPPVYGSSEIRDITPYNQSSEFTIFGNSETSNSIESLDLYYRYSDNNETWTPWILYNTDFDGSDGWSWEFNSPNGTGYYQFYSIRHVHFEHEWLNETAPPGPDAIAKITI